MFKKTILIVILSISYASCAGDRVPTYASINNSPLNEDIYKYKAQQCRLTAHAVSLGSFLVGGFVGGSLTYLFTQSVGIAVGVGLGGFIIPTATAWALFHCMYGRRPPKDLNTL